jgi:hypothetical protein
MMPRKPKLSMTKLPNIEVALTGWLCCRPMVGFPAVLA